jgi:phosphopantothenoylcysteine synthetase/decarboxylase
MVRWKMEKRNSGAVLVTSGPTRAYFDSVRYIANKSSGALGARIVEEFIARGVPVIHIMGSGNVKPSVGTNPVYFPVDIETLDNLSAAIDQIKADRSISAIVHAMAVLDYTPEHRVEEKKLSGDDFWDVRLVKTPKYIGIMRKMFPEAFFVGFKLETGLSEEMLLEKAVGLIKKNNIDIVVANDTEKIGADYHEAFFVNASGAIVNRAETKDMIAKIIADLVIKNTR